LDCKKGTQISQKLWEIIEENPKTTPASISLKGIEENPKKQIILFLLTQK
jgi:hypothetical protein